MFDTSKKITEFVQARLKAIEPRLRELQLEKDRLEIALKALQGTTPQPPAGPQKKVFHLSPAARKKIAAAQKKRWAAIREGSATA